MKKVDSKYSLVVAASRRAREMGDVTDARLKLEPKSHKPVGIALEEIYADILVVAPTANSANQE